MLIRYLLFAVVCFLVSFIFFGKYKEKINFIDHYKPEGDNLKKALKNKKFNLSTTLFFLLLGIMYIALSLR